MKCFSDKMTSIVVKALRRIVRPFTLPGPIGIGKIGGRGSRIEFPREILNCKHLKIGDGTLVRRNSHILAVAEGDGSGYNPLIVIEDDVYIGRHSFITCQDKIVIGAGTVISDYLYISDTAHGVDPKRGKILLQPLESKGPVVIGQNCFIGMRVSILPGVTLGDWCIVGAHSVVTRSFPKYSMIAGVPARIIRRYNPETGIWATASSGGTT